MAERSRDRTALLIALGALVIFLPAIWWGIPDATSGAMVRGWDVDAVGGVSTLAEFHNLLVAAKPDWYVAYPGFHYIVLGAAYAPYLAVLWLTGGLASPTPSYPFGLEDPAGTIATLAVLGRLVSLAMAVGIVVAAYKIGRLLWDRGTGILVAVLAVLIGPLVYGSRTGNLDVPALFWTALGILVLARASVDGLTLKRAALLGLFAALSTATKDQAYGVWLGAMPLLFFMHFRHRLADDDKNRRTPRWRAPAVMIVTGLVVYLVANGVLSNPERLVRHVQFVLAYREPRLDHAELGLERSRTLFGTLHLLWDFTRITAVAAGPTIALLGVLGLVTGWRRFPFLSLTIAMLAGYFALFIVPVAHMQLRYAIFPALLLVIPAAFLVTRAWRVGGWRRTAVGAAVVLGVGWTSARAGDMTYQMVRDARWEAGWALAGQLQVGDRVGYFGDAGQLPHLPAGVSVVPLSDGSPEALAQAEVDALLIIPDYTTPPGWEHSLSLPAPTYTALKEGSLGFERVARFETAPALGFTYPFVNPIVQVFVRREAEAKPQPG